MLSPAGDSGLGLLMPALTGRWDSVSVVLDEPGVMEELGAGAVSVVVVVKPETWPWLKQLAFAIGQHYGHVLCMQFEREPGNGDARVTALASRWLSPDTMAGAPGHLVQVETPLGQTAAREQAVIDAGSGEVIEPLHDALRLVPGPGEAEQDATSLRRRLLEELVVHVPAGGPGEPAVPESLVSEEELSMLLGPTGEAG